jgi:hypothetical protein
LPASIRGLVKRDLLAYINGQFGYDLPASIAPIPPADLPAYIKSWPQDDLPAYLRGWVQRDLTASIFTAQSRDLPAVIGTHLWKDLGARLKGYGIEEPRDLPASIGAVLYSDLPASLWASYLYDLPASVYPIRPVDLPASLMGYQASDLPAYLNGRSWPYELPASIVASGGYRDLPATIAGFKLTNVGRDLPASISAWWTGDLQGIINVVAPADLSATLYVDGGSYDLPAFIYPKMIRLTTVVSFITMSAKDLSAVINVCGGSGYLDLSASLTLNYIADLAAVVIGKYAYNSTLDLAASVGRENKYFVLDKLPLSITIGNTSYRVYDKIPLKLELSRQASSIFASIVGEYTSSNLGATVEVVNIEPYLFETTKSKERVYFGLTDNNGLAYETAEISFRQIVSDYFFNSATSEVYKIDPLEKWIADFKSFIPSDTELGVKRRMHKEGVMNDIERFANIDEAVRFLMDYVTSYPQENLGASIASKGQFSTLGAQITGS